MDLFGQSAKPTKRTKEPAPNSVVHRLLKVYIGLWQQEFAGESPAIAPADAKAIKNLAQEFGVSAVESRLPIFVGLEDGYLREQAYPLRLMRGAWNRCTVILQQRTSRSHRTDIHRTSQYLQKLQKGRQ